MSGKDMKNFSRTSLDRISQLTDDQIDTSDIPPLTDSDFKRASLRMPPQPVEITLHLDPELLAWFKAHGEHYEAQINAALRIYVEAHRAYKV